MNNKGHQNFTDANYRGLKMSVNIKNNKEVKHLLCSCGGTMDIESKVISKALGYDKPLPIFSSLCSEEQQEVMSCLEENEGRVTIACTQFQGLFPNQEDIVHNTFPYFDGGASISRTARPYPSWLIFKPAMFLTSYLLIRYWLFNKDIIKYFEVDHKNLKKIVFLKIKRLIISQNQRKFY